MNREQILRRRIRLLTWFFIVGSVISGATAIPLQSEVDWLAKCSGAEKLAAESAGAPIWALWLVKVQTALQETGATHPILFYGTDWLAFGHFVIAIAFIGALRDPVRNRWLYDFGLIACVLVIPYALMFGGTRGIPIWWRLIDCSFGVLGMVPLWFCRRWVNELRRSRASRETLKPLFSPEIGIDLEQNKQSQRREDLDRKSSATRGLRTLRSQPFNLCFLCVLL